MTYMYICTIKLQIKNMHEIIVCEDPERQNIFSHIKPPTGIRIGGW